MHLIYNVQESDNMYKIETRVANEILDPSYVDGSDF